jgi:hypothetical protein
MKRLAAALFIAVVAAVGAAPALSSGSSVVKQPVVKKQPMQQFRAHDGPCPFASMNADV